MKKIISLFLCLLMLMGLTACGAEETVSMITSTNETGDEMSEEAESSKEESQSEDESSSSKKNSSNKKASSNIKNSSNKQNKPGVNINSSKNKGSSSKRVNTTSKDPLKSKYPSRQNSIQIRRINQDKFKKVGRWIVNSNQLGIGLNWTCSSVEFNVDCIGDLALEFEKTGTNPVLYLKIYVDGKLIAERTNVESGQLTIASNLDPGVHSVKIVRSSDGDCGPLTLKKVLAYGTLVEPPKNGSLYIEAIGDASLIGWGSRLDDTFFENFVQSVARNKENQDGTVIYPYVAAQKLGADAYAISKQGVGIAATYHMNDGICSPRNGLLPTICDYAAVWGNTKYTVDRVPDVIVIDAGAADIENNLQKCVKDGDKIGIDTARAKAISVEFLNKLKTVNPNAKIIWCYGLTMDKAELEKYISDVVSLAGGEKNEIYTLKLPYSTRKNGYPSAKEHAAAATLLANKIKQITK